MALGLAESVSANCPLFILPSRPYHATRPLPRRSQPRRTCAAIVPRTRSMRRLLLATPDRPYRLAGLLAAMAGATSMGAPYQSSHSARMLRPEEVTTEAPRPRGRVEGTAGLPVCRSCQTGPPHIQVRELHKTPCI